MGDFPNCHADFKSIQCDKTNGCSNSLLSMKDEIQAQTSICTDPAPAQWGGVLLKHNLQVGVDLEEGDKSAL